ncbi:hypothetical protein [Arcanobacterium ihumii]|uniref:hypothetical protein n=1 Tax=Arcanobacterium ihumii TaxID=2138162 RepID=UPI000F544475|nr:hypothetical protein [Arcanobacterium ihumii]
MNGYKAPLLKALSVAGRANPGVTVLREEEGVSMRHIIKVRVRPETDSVLRVREMRLRDRLARRIFGASDRYAVLIPGASVDEVTIVENQSDDLMAIADAIQGGERE